MSYIQKYVDQVMQGLSVKGMTSETRSRLASSLRAMLVARINNKIYESLSYDQLIDLYQKIDQADTADAADTIIMNYLDEANIDVLAVAEQAYQDIAREYHSTMNRRLVSAGGLA